MRKQILFILVLIMSLTLSAQKQINIHSQSFGTESFEISESDSAGFSNDQSIFYLYLNAGQQEFQVSEIDSITFSLINENIIYIEYNDNDVIVTNPLAGIGVEVETAGANVTVTSTSEVRYITYALSGNTSNGMFKIYSDEHYNLLLNGVEIENPDGPPLNLQSGKNVNIILEPDTDNILADGAEYADPPGEEDQDGTVFSEGDIKISGSGSLTIHSNGIEQDGIYSKDGITISEGTITVASASNDGIHGKDGVDITGGAIEITSNGDGIDAKNGVLAMYYGEVTIHSTADDVKAMKSDSTITVMAGIINVFLDGDQSKGIDADQGVYIYGGEINIDATGGVVLEESGSGYDPSYCSAISSDGDIIFSDCEVDISTTGDAGRGVSCDGNLNIREDALINIEASGDGAKYTNEEGDDDGYHGSCLNADGDLLMTGGVITLSNSGSGGKGISVDGEINLPAGDIIPELNITTTGNPILITQGGGWGQSSDYDESKSIKADNLITINNGLFTIQSADDGIKSDAGITINGGFINITGSIEGVEAPEIIFNGGEIYITASDDAVNATYGVGGEQSDGSLLSVTGGYLMLNTTGGDAIDSNGDFMISGGTMIVHGPPSQPEVGMDVNGDKLVSGGFIIVSGTNSNMTENFSSGSSQYSVLFRTNNSQSASTIFHIEDAEGNDIVTFAPNRRYYSMLFSSVMLATGESYSVYTGGNSTGDYVDGLYTGGTYSGGTLATTFTVSGMTNTVWF